jgi:hypothetical protein
MINRKGAGEHPVSLFERIGSDIAKMTQQDSQPADQAIPQPGSHVALDAGGRCTWCELEYQSPRYSGLGNRSLCPKKRRKLNEAVDMILILTGIEQSPPHA